MAEDAGVMVGAVINSIRRTGVKSPSPHRGATNDRRESRRRPYGTKPRKNTGAPNGSNSACGPQAPKRFPMLRSESLKLNCRPRLRTGGAAPGVLRQHRAESILRGQGGETVAAFGNDRRMHAVHYRRRSKPTLRAEASARRLLPEHVSRRAAGKIEPMISPARWAKAQDILDRKRTATRARRRKEYEIALGLGLLRCRCGRFLYLRREYRPGRHSYYFCGSGHRGVSCGAPSIQRVKVDAEFESAVASFADVAAVRGMVEQALKPAAKAQRPSRRIARSSASQLPESG